MKKSIQSNRMIKRAIGMAKAGGLISLVVTLYETYFTSRGPLSPDMTHGIVVPWNNHGTIHYITESRLIWQVGSFTAIIVFAMIVVILELWMKWSERRVS